MSVTRRLARPMLSAIFVASGIEGLRRPGGMVEMAEPQATAMASKLGLPTDPELLVRINSGVHVGAGLLLAIGKFRRLSALALFGTLIPTTWAAHRFWEEQDPAAKVEQQSHFLKNVGLMGGLILCAVDTEGAPSLGWRARRRAAQAGTAIALGGKAAKKAAPTGDGGATGKKAAKKAAKAASKGAKAAAKAAAIRELAAAKGGAAMEKASAKADKAAAKAAKRAARARSAVVAGAGKAGAGAAKAGAKAAVAKKAVGALADSDLAAAGARRASEVVTAASSHLPVG